MQPIWDVHEITFKPVTPARSGSWHITSVVEARIDGPAVFGVSPIRAMA
jgi:hypothetical protein